MDKQPETLQGSYRLHAGFTQVSITNNTVTIKLKNAYTFNRQSNANKPKSIKLANPANSQTQIAEEDKQLVDLFQSIEEYEYNGGMMRLYGSGHTLLMRARKQSQQHNNNQNIQGQWKTELVNLALEVSDSRFTFEGINNVRYLLSYQAFKDGSIEFELQTEQEESENKKQKNSATIDFDVIFINALLRSRTFKLGEVSFELFDEDGKLIGKGTPYL